MNIDVVMSQKIRQLLNYLLCLGIGYKKAPSTSYAEDAISLTPIASKYENLTIRRRLS